jgi:hypothetical protein
MPEPFRAVITVPWDVQRTADNVTRGLHWSGKGRVNRAARELARLCWLEAGAPRAPGKVRVRVLVRRGRVLDTTNAIGGLKPLLDGIFVDALTRSDSARWLEFAGCVQETGARWAGNRAEVVFEVEALP